MGDLLNKPLFSRTVILIAGSLVPYAFAPYGLYFLAPLALLILFYFWVNSTSPKAAFILGYVFGFAMFGVGVNWLHISINLFGGVNIIGALVLTFLLIALMSLYPACCGYLFIRYFKDYYLVSLPSLWLVIEWWRGWFLTGFPWLNIGTSQTDSLFSAFAPVIGDYGISFMVCLSAAALLGVLTGKKKQRLISIALLVAIVSSSQLLAGRNWTLATNQVITVALIQGAIPQQLKWDADYRRHTYKVYTELTAPHWSADLVIWPETAIPSLYHQANDFIDGITAKISAKKTLFLSGIAYHHKAARQYFNSVLLLAAGQHHSFYHKHHLVPFGEYLPLQPIFSHVFSFLSIPMSDFSKAELPQKNLLTPIGRLGASICYEIAYANYIRRALPAADILVNISNDAWFGDSIAPHQHLQIARMRALENGRYLLRATNNGISAVIDHRGNIAASAPQFNPYALATQAKLVTGITPYSQYGHQPILFFSWLLLLISLMANRYRKKFIKL